MENDFTNNLKDKIDELQDVYVDIQELSDQLTSEIGKLLTNERFNADFDASWEEFAKRKIVRKLTPDNIVENWSLAATLHDGCKRLISEGIHLLEEIDIDNSPISQELMCILNSNSIKLPPKHASKESIVSFFDIDQIITLIDKMDGLIKICSMAIPTIEDCILFLGYNY